MRCKTHVSVLALTLLVSLGTGSSASAQVQKRDLDIRAGDDANLKATYYDPGKPGPAILLLHQCNRDRKSWTSLATTLASKGIHVLTLDYRGYGESDGAGAPRSERRAQRAKWESDIETAYRTMLSQPGVTKDNVGAGGASCGVSNSIRLARKHSEIKTLVLLSGGTNDAGFTYLRTNSALSVFGAASEEDTGSARSIRRIVETSSHRESKLAMYNNAGHGVPMFAKEPELEPMIVDWFTAQLAPR